MKAYTGNTEGNHNESRLGDASTLYNQVKFLIDVLGKPDLDFIYSPVYRNILKAIELRINDHYGRFPHLEELHKIVVELDHKHKMISFENQNATIEKGKKDWLKETNKNYESEKIKYDNPEDYEEFAELDIHFHSYIPSFNSRLL